MIYLMKITFLVNKALKSIEEVFFGKINLEICMIVMCRGLAFAFEEYYT